MVTPWSRAFYVRFPAVIPCTRRGGSRTVSAARPRAGLRRDWARGPGRGVDVERVNEAARPAKARKGALLPRRLSTHPRLPGPAGQAAIGGGEIVGWVERSEPICRHGTDSNSNQSGNLLVRRGAAAT